MKQLLKISSYMAVIVGILMVIGGAWGIIFTYHNVMQEKIITPGDALIPDVLVKGPFTLMSQAKIIREHTLSVTEGKTFSEMPRLIPAVDENENYILDEAGDPVMVYNSARDIWITATTLTTALNLAIVTYILSFFILLFGMISIWTGIIFYMLSNKPLITKK